MFALLQTNHGPCSTPQNLLLRDAMLLVHPPAVSTVLAMLSSSNLSLAFPAKARTVAPDAEDSCCFPLECSLLPLQKSLEASKSSLGHFHTRGYCTHRVRQSLPDESGMSLATIKVWGETHISQLVLAPTRARAGQGNAD